MLIIDKKQFEEIVQSAQTAPTHEVCGILAGTADRVTKVYRMKNTSETPEHCYFMDPLEQLKVLKDIRRQQLAMVGIYHSHPDSAAYPSARDVELAFYDEVHYLIVSLRDKTKPAARAFKITGGEISEQEIKGS